jgi:hypothetical protein
MKIPGYAKNVPFNYTYRRDLGRLWMASDRPLPTLSVRQNMLSVPLMTAEMKSPESRAIVCFESERKGEIFARGFHMFELTADDAVLISTMARMPIAVILDNGEDDGTELVHFIKT